MKRFLIRIFYFALPLIIATWAALAYNSFKRERALSAFKFPDGVTILFAGDSHIVCGIKDSIVPGSMNIGQNSEALFFTYYKLKALLPGSRIKKVFLGVGYHSFSPSYDERVYGKLSADVCPRYFYSLPTWERFKMKIANFNDLTLLHKRLFRKNYEKEFYGGYANYFVKTRADSISILKRIRFQFIDTANNSLYDPSGLNFEYLVKIKELCQENNIELFAINTPLNAYYRSNVPGNFVDYFKSCIVRSRVKLIDFSTLNLSDSLYIPDGDHLSAAGSHIFTNSYIK